MTTFNKYVEIGRVCRIKAGRNAGKMVVIVDVVDQNRALVNSLDMPRGQLNFKNLVLTKYTVDVPRNARTKVLKKALIKDGTVEKFNKLPSVQRLARYAKRQTMTDFDRFKVMVAKKQVSLNVRQEANKLKKAANKK